MTKSYVIWAVLIGGLALGTSMVFGEISHRAYTAPLAKVYVNDVKTVAGIDSGLGITLSPNPSSAFTLETGLLYYDSTVGRLRYYDGSTLWTIGTGD